MNKIDHAIREIHLVDAQAQREIWINQIHPLSKLLVTLLFVICVMSFEKNQITGLAGMCLYLVVTMILGEISAKRAFCRSFPILCTMFVLSLVNLFFDREVVFVFGTMTVTGGMLSMLSLLMKAGFAVFAVFILIETTSIENICYAMQLIHVPSVIITLVMLIYRYLILMMKEVQRTSLAYSLRAPKQKGIHRTVWGTLAGNIMLRSIDRAQKVYDSMSLRGFCGRFYCIGCLKPTGVSILYAIVWTFAILMFRVLPLFEIAGRLLSKVWR